MGRLPSKAHEGGESTEPIAIEYIEKPDLKDATLIEGLPGVGNVGKLAAEHLIDQLSCTKFADVYSTHFPPQVLVDDQGLVKLVNNELYYSVRDGANSDLIFLVGDYQGLTPEGQYTLCDFILKEVRQFDVRRIFTLGGYGMARIVDKPRVLGAATSTELIQELEKFGVVFTRAEPGTGIVGASGLLLGLGKLQGLDSVCLMGETSGYFADPRSAQAVLEILAKVLDLEVDFEELQTKAKQIEQITSRLREIETAESKPEDLGYIG